MKKIILLLLFITVAVFYADAQSRPFGLGLIVGEPTGISMKYWINDNNAVDGAVAWNYTNNGFFHVHADYLWHWTDLIQVDEGTLPVYVGVGGRIGFGNEIRVGARIPVGIEYIFENEAFDVFLEVAPLLDLTPGTQFNMQGGIGGRYFF